MALLSFPPSPSNGEYYPVAPMAGQIQYQWEASTQTWRLVGASTGVNPGTYGDANNIPRITIDPQGRITVAAIVPLNTTYIKTNNVLAYNSYIWPNGDGLVGTALKTDSVGNLSWDHVGSVDSVNVSGGTTGLVFTGGPITLTGTITASGILAVTNGGTGAGTANAALNNLLPAQAGQANEVLTTDGSNTSWKPLGFVTFDDVSGSFNGTATSFSLRVNSVAFPPSPSKNIMVFLGGVAQTPGASKAYTVSGSTITFSSPPPIGTTFYATTVSF